MSSIMIHHAPFPYREEPYPPACLCPVSNEETGNTIWLELLPSDAGLYITIHRSKPAITHSNESSPETAMAMLHVGFFSDQQGREQVNVQLYDEREGPDGPINWQLPEHDPLTGEAGSIVLVEDVLRWRPPEEC